MQPAIQISGLSKQYRLGQAVQGDRTLRDTLVQAARRLTGRDVDTASRNTGEFWALDDISLSVQPGEIVGIVGHNGAGKSTLLKILSGITAPTRGRAEIRGRVASLLEVGTGFHPELSGRENIFLNGAILGMSRREVRDKFENIVAFSGVERFLDTPVKRYSSGMRVRLAFAVAAHLDPEILIVDEVLAVGDAAFQTKCLGKMQELASGGRRRTVLFVSHNMSSVRSLCSRAVYLERGKVIADGTPNDIITLYRTGLEAGRTRPIAEQIAAAPHDPAIRIQDVAVSQVGETPGHYVTGKPIDVRVTYRVLEPTHGLRVDLVLYDTDGTPLFRSICDSELDDLPLRTPGRYTSHGILPADLLAPVMYDLGVSASVYNDRRCFPQPISCRMQIHDQGRIKHAYVLNGPVGFKMAPLIPWVTNAISDDAPQKINEKAGHRSQSVSAEVTDARAA